jgi:hypothetical protein
MPLCFSFDQVVDYYCQGVEFITVLCSMFICELQSSSVSSRSERPKKVKSYKESVWNFIVIQNV